jgi:hypothetical protein
MRRNRNAPTRRRLHHFQEDGPLQDITANRLRTTWRAMVKSTHKYNKNSKND